MTLADEVYKEVIKRVPTAIRKFGADALGNQIIKVTKNNSETNAKKLAAEVIKNLGIKLNEATFDELSLKLSEAEVDKILGKLLRIVDNIQSPEQLQVAEKYYDLAVKKIGTSMFELSTIKSLYFIASEIDMMLKLARQKYSPVDEGQIYSTGGGAGQSYRKFTPKVDKTSISQESSIMKGLVDEDDVIPFPKKKKPVKSGTDEITGLPLTPSESEFLCVDLDTGKVLSTHPSSREAAIAKRQWEQWGKKSVGIQEI